MKRVDNKILHLCIPFSKVEKWGQHDVLTWFNWSVHPEDMRCIKAFRDIRL